MVGAFEAQLVQPPDVDVLAQRVGVGIGIGAALVPCQPTAIRLSATEIATCRA
jgi:hypothetical protein